MNKIKGAHSLVRETSTQNYFISQNTIPNGQMDMQRTRGVQKRQKLIPIWGNREDFVKRNHLSEPYRILTGKEFMDHVNSRNSQRCPGFFFIQDNSVHSPWS